MYERDELEATVEPIHASDEVIDIGDIDMEYLATQTARPLCVQTIFYKKSRKLQIPKMQTQISKKRLLESCAIALGIAWLSYIQMRESQLASQSMRKWR